LLNFVQIWWFHTTAQRWFAIVDTEQDASSAQYLEAVITPEFVRTNDGFEWQFAIFSDRQALQTTSAQHTTTTTTNAMMPTSTPTPPQQEIPWIIITVSVLAVAVFVLSIAIAFKCRRKSRIVTRASDTSVNVTRKERLPKAVKVDGLHDLFSNAGKEIGRSSTLVRRNI
jgi:hypothetical protein